MSLENKKVIIIGSDPLLTSEEKVYTKSPFLRFFKYFKPYFGQITLAAPSRRLSTVQNEWSIGFRKNELVALPYFAGVVDFVIKSPINIWRTVHQLKKEIKKNDFVMILHDDFLGIISSIIANYYKKPRLLFIGGNQKEVVGNKYKGIKKRIAISLAGFFEMMNRFYIKRGLLSLITGRDIIDHYKKYGENVYPYFTSLIEEDDITERENDFRETIKIAYAGFLNENKGLEYLIRAGNILKSSEIESEINIIGDGPDRNRLEEIAKGLEVKVDFHGFVSDKERIKELFLTNNIFVLPSLSEGIPKVLLEAMAYGLNVITTNVGGISDIVTNNQNGIFVETKNSQDIADKIIALADDQDKTRLLQKNGYDYVRNHTADKQAKDIVGIIERVYFA